MSNHPKWKHRWSFTKHCKTNQVAYRSFVGEPEAAHDLYALVKTKRKKKIRQQWEEKQKATARVPVNIKSAEIVRRVKSQRVPCYPSVRKMIEIILPMVTHSPFSYTDMREKCFNCYPDSCARIRRGFSSACRYLFEFGVLRKVDGGMIIGKLNRNGNNMLLTNHNR